MTSWSRSRTIVGLVALVIVGAGLPASKRPMSATLEVDIGEVRDSQVEDRFDATLLRDFQQDDRVLIPAGSVLRGVVSGVQRAGRTDRKGSLTLSFDQIVIQGQVRPIRANVAQLIESRGVMDEKGKLATAAGIGGVLGGLFGGTKGAVLGGLIGAGGTLAATDGKDVDLPVGSVLRVRFDSPLTVN